MYSTRVTQHVDAPRPAVYRALLDADAVAKWRVPDGMTSQVHEFDPTEGGTFRISLTYDAPTGAGKSSANTDTYAGRFTRLVADELVEETLAFESTDPAMRHPMTMTTTLTDGADGGTEVLVVHDGLPDAIPPADNETGHRMSLARLARLVESASDG